MKRNLFPLLFVLFAIICNGQTAYKTRTGSKYHTNTCRYLNRSYQSTVAQARTEGLTACSVCNPVSASTKTSTDIILHQTSSKQPSDNLSSTTSTSSVQCSGITKAGARCKRRNTNMNGRCYQH
jgi:hypothetical protein